MSESGNFDDMRGDGERVDTPVDPYTTESSADIYATPEVSMDTTGVVVDDTPPACGRYTRTFFRQRPVRGCLWRSGRRTLLS